MRFLDPATLLSRLDQALSTGWAQDVPDRQRTMRTTLDWSHNLLSEAERALFRRLSVFVGGFTLEAAEAVGPGRSVGAEDVLSLLRQLVDQSLVVTEIGAHGAMRYYMLEPVRQYALERLEEGDDAGTTSRNHGIFFLALAEEAASELMGSAGRVAGEAGRRAGQPSGGHAMVAGRRRIGRGRQARLGAAAVLGETRALR